MKLARNPFRAALESGTRQIGIWVSLSDNFAAEVIAGSGYDWALLDMEHSPNDLRTVLGQLQTFEASGTTAIVRPEWNDPVLVKRLLDVGVTNLLFPMVQSVEEAEQAVSAMRYPPRGVRGVSGATRANKFGRVTDYFSRFEEESVGIVQIETRAALMNAEAIAAVDGVNGVFFGPADIGADIGALGKPMDPSVWDAIRPVAQKLIAKGGSVGTLVQDAKFAASLLADGFTFVACGSDASLLAAGADQRLADVKRELG